MLYLSVHPAPGAQLKLLRVIISQMFVELKLGPRLRLGCSSRLFQALGWVGQQRECWEWEIRLLNTNVAWAAVLE